MSPLICISCVQTVNSSTESFTVIELCTYIFAIFFLFSKEALALIILIIWRNQRYSLIEIHALRAIILMQRR